MCTTSDAAIHVEALARTFGDVRAVDSVVAEGTPSDLERAIEPDAT